MSFLTPSTLATRAALPNVLKLKLRFAKVNSATSARKLQQQVATHVYILTIEKMNTDERAKNNPGKGLYAKYLRFEQARIQEQLNEAIAFHEEINQRLPTLGEGFAGRPFTLDPEQQAEAIRRREAGETLASIAQSYGVSEMTISRLVRGVSRKKENAPASEE